MNNEDRMMTVFFGGIGILLGALGVYVFGAMVGSTICFFNPEKLSCKIKTHSEIRIQNVK